MRPIEFFRNGYRDGKTYLNDIEKNRNIIRLRVKTGSIGFQPVRPVEFFRNGYRDGKTYLNDIEKNRQRDCNMTDITIYTIGFTKKSASRFFGLLKDSGAKRIVDVRLNNRSQLAGFSKQDDLPFFLQELCGMDYVHLPELAPTQDILDAYKKNKGDWGEYEIKFLELMEQRAIEKTLSKPILHEGCLLCSEDQPHHCHRQLVIDYLSQKWDNQIKVIHLM